MNRLRGGPGDWPRWWPTAGAVFRVGIILAGIAWFIWQLSLSSRCEKRGGTYVQGRCLAVKELP